MWARKRKVDVLNINYCVIYSFDVCITKLFYLKFCSYIYRISYSLKLYFYAASRVVGLLFSKYVCLLVCVFFEVFARED